MPAGEVKGQVGLILSKHSGEIWNSDDVARLFANLSNIQAWDFLHPQLLEYIVQELGGNDAKRDMEEYKARLVQFRQTTKMYQLSGWFGNIPENSSFQKIVLLLGNDWKYRTYEDFEKLRVSLLRQQAMFHPSLSLCGVLSGSIAVVFAVPKSINMRDVKRMMREANLWNYDLYAEQVCLIRNYVDQNVIDFEDDIAPPQRDVSVSVASRTV